MNNKKTVALAAGFILLFCLSYAAVLASAFNPATEKPEMAETSNPVTEQPEKDYTFWKPEMAHTFDDATGMSGDVGRASLSALYIDNIV
ncbi:MAG: hypothetical protein ACFFAY_15970 [Promethearchaeota archaeon]